MRDQVFQSIRERALLRAGDRVAVAVSGGADSVALLRVLLELRAELGIVLSVAHFHHGLRDAAAADQAFVAALAKEHGLEFYAGRGEVRDHAFTSKLSIEAAGRELRYRWFAELAGERRLDAIATAHTLDDQAETVLLKLLRGAGTRGLAGIFPVVELRTSGAKAPAAQKGSTGTPEGVPLQNSATMPPEGVPLQNSATMPPEGVPRIIRPLLQVSRQEVENYLTALGQSWREDESNLDRRFLRNRVRRELLPLLEREFNASIRRTLSDLAEIARGEEEFWQQQVAGELSSRLEPELKSPLLPGPEAGLKARSSIAGAGSLAAEAGSAAGSSGSFEACPSPDSLAGRGFKSSGGRVTPPERLVLDGFATLPLALQRRLLKSFATRRRLTLDFEHIERLRRCALGELSRTELPGGRIAVRDGRALCILAPPLPQESTSYHYLLPIPGEIQVAEAKLMVRAEIVPAEFAMEVASGELLSLNLLAPELLVRNWLPGDRFWPAHSRSEEKLKRLFAEKRIPAADRPGWPVVASGDQIVWVRGFPAANRYRWRGIGDAVRVEAIAG